MCVIVKLSTLTVSVSFNEMTSLKRFLFSVDTALHYGPNAKRQHVMQVYPRCLSDRKEFGVLDMRIIVFLLTI